MTKPPHVIQDWLDVIQENGRGLTDWEGHFVESLADQFERIGSISDRQEELLERIYAEKTP